MSRVATAGRCGALRKARWLIRLVAGVVALGAATGCVSSMGSSSRGRSFDSPKLSADYPEWTTQSTSSSMSRLVKPAGAWRQDRYFLLRRGDFRLLAVYSRSAKTQRELGTQPWRNPDALFKGQSRLSTMGESLLEQFSKDNPNEFCLGAYEHESMYYVGFYREVVLGNTKNFVRGEHGYTYDRQTQRWRKVLDDTLSDSSWETCGEVR